MVAHDVTALDQYLCNCVTQFSQKRGIDRQTSGLTKTCEIEFQMTQAGMTRDLFSEKTQGRPMGEFPINFVNE